MYKMYDGNENDLADFMADYGKPDVTGDWQNEPNGSVGRYIELLDHNATLQEKDGTAPREFGNDYIVGNADNDSTAPFKSDTRNAFRGVAQLIVRSTGEGPIEITATAEGLQAGRVRVTAGP